MMCFVHSVRMMKYLKSVKYIIICSVLLLLCVLKNDAIALYEITIKGNSIIPTATVNVYAGLAQKNIVNERDIQNAINNLYATAFFSDVKIEKNNNNINISVKENYRIRKISIEGRELKRSKKNTIKKLLAVQPKSSCVLMDVYADAVIIKAFFQSDGYYAVKVDPEIIKVNDNIVDLVYNVDCGKKAKIRSIEIIGNNAVKSSKLKSLILSKEDAFFRFGSSSYNAQRLEADELMLNNYYVQKGYLDFKITSVVSELMPSKDAFIVKFVIDEGMRYTFYDFRLFNSIEGLDEKKIVDLVTLEKGEILDYNQVVVTQDKIANYLKGLGYATATVSFDILRDIKEAKAVVEFKIESGHKFYINQININNNTRTKDNVIRKFLTVKEGDYYSASKVERSRLNILSSGYFAAVNIRNSYRPNNPDLVDINIDVTETSTGNVNLNCTYSPSNGFGGSVGMAEHNFLGRGQFLSLQLGTESASKDQKYFYFGFTQPDFLDLPVNAGFDCNWKRVVNQQAKYVSNSTSVILRAQYELFNGLMQSVRYSWNHRSLSNKDKNSFTLLDFDQRYPNGASIDSSIGYTLYWQHSGHSTLSVVLKQDFPVLGGDVYHVKNDIEASLVIPLHDNGTSLRFKVSGTKIHPTEAKGVSLLDHLHTDEKVLRGFTADSIAPRIKVIHEDGTVQDQSIGGKNLYSGSIELIVPSGLPEEIGVNFGVFVDFATLYGYDLSTEFKEKYLKKWQDEGGTISYYNNMNLRASFGPVIFVRSPLLGNANIQFFYGFPISKELHDSTRKEDRFGVSIGDSF